MKINEAKEKQIDSQIQMDKKSYRRKYMLAAVFALLLIISAQVFIFLTQEIRPGQRENNPRGRRSVSSNRR